MREKQIFIQSFRFQILITLRRIANMLRILTKRKSVPPVTMAGSNPLVEVCGNGVLMISI